MDDPREVIRGELERIIPRHPTNNYVEETTLREVQELLYQLEQLDPGALPGVNIDTPLLWSDRPRLYMLLYMLRDTIPDFEALLVTFDLNSIEDTWLPAPRGAFTKISSGLNWKQFEATQRYILSKPSQMSAVDLFQIPPVHRHMLLGTTIFKDQEQIGLGRSSEVYAVQHRHSKRVFACKHVDRHEDGTLTRQQEQYADFVTELKILRKLNHQHIVTLEASYTDTHAFSLVLSPVADGTLQSKLADLSPPPSLEGIRRDSILDHIAAIPRFDVPAADKIILRYAFGCLLSTLAYLHDENVRHKDIKPGNILLSGSRVYLCDFGISLDYSGTGEATTEGRPNQFTPGYCAPEVAMFETRNVTSDIWSLGRVFADMITALKGYSIHHAKDFIDLEPDMRPMQICKWLDSLEPQTAECSDNIMLPVIKQMVSKEAKERPKAMDVLLGLLSSSDLGTRSFDYVGPCCQKKARLEQMPVHRQIGMSDADDTPQDQREIRPLMEAAPASPNLSADDTSTVDGDRESARDCGAQLQRSVTWSSRRCSTTRPQPVNLSATCECSPRRSSQGVIENHVINLPMVSFSNDDDKSSTMEIQHRCGNTTNAVQVYQSCLHSSNDMRWVWLQTRRMVLSYVSESSGRRSCTSFWLPLTDLHYGLNDATVTLKWSDCNQWKKMLHRNLKDNYDRVYAPEQTNNAVSITFESPKAAEQFTDAIRFPPIYGGSSTIWQHLSIAGAQDLYITDISGDGILEHRVAVLVDRSGQLDYSRVLIHWPDFDVEIEALAESSPAVAVEFRRVCTPEYISDVTKQQTQSIARIGRCIDAKLSYCAYKIVIPVGELSPSQFPSDGVHLFQYLTGWIMCFFGARIKMSMWSSRSLDVVSRHKSLGPSDVILWKRDKPVHAPNTALDMRITFRHRGNSPNYLWTAGTTVVTDANRFNLKKSEFCIKNMSQGSLLDTANMAAIEPDSKPTSLDRKQYRVRLEFTNDTDHKSFYSAFHERR